MSKLHVIIGSTRPGRAADLVAVNPVADINLRIALDDLKWWSDVLEAARANGQLPPAAFRIQAAAAALNEVEDEVA